MTTTTVLRILMSIRNFMHQNRDTLRIYLDNYSLLQALQFIDLKLSIII